jgi:PadR family transcriptional regulator PadR
MGKGDYLGEFEQIVLLAVLRLGKNAYGVTIWEEIERRAERPVMIGAVYATLDRLEAKRYISSKVGDPTPERGGRAKRNVCFYCYFPSRFKITSAAICRKYSLRLSFPVVGFFELGSGTGYRLSVQYVSSFGFVGIHRLRWNSGREQILFINQCAM